MYIFINKINRITLLKFISFILLFTINLSLIDDYLFDIFDKNCCELYEEPEDESKEENKKTIEEDKISTEFHNFNLHFLPLKSNKLFYFFEINYVESLNSLIHTPPPEFLAS